MPLIAHGVVGVMTPHVYPVPGTIWPMNGDGRISPVSGFCARRAPLTSTGL
jgi:hypothetical protein